MTIPEKTKSASPHARVADPSHVHGVMDDGDGTKPTSPFGRRRWRARRRQGSMVRPKIATNFGQIVARHPLVQCSSAGSFQTPLGAGDARARRCRAAVENIGHLPGDAVGGHPKRFIDVDIPLGDASGRVAEQGSNRQFGKTEIAGQAGKGVAQGVRRDVGEPRFFADAIQHPDHTDKMAISPAPLSRRGRMRMPMDGNGCHSPHDPT
jgi:hypothetical protein